MTDLVATVGRTADDVLAPYASSAAVLASGLMKAVNARCDHRTAFEPVLSLGGGSVVVGTLDKERSDDGKRDQLE